jgi:hypothetical protein
MERKPTKNRGAGTGETREARLKAALRANLAKRKAQARARGASEDAATEKPKES